MKHTQQKKSTAKNSSEQNLNIIDFFSKVEIIEDYPVLPRKKDFMHIRSPFLFNQNLTNGKKN